MSIYNRQGLAHSRKVITSSVGFTKPRYSVEAGFQYSAKETKRNFSGNVSSTFIISEGSFHRDLPQVNDRYLGNMQDILEVKKTPTIFDSISKPSAAIDRLVTKRKTDHEDAVKKMNDELTASYAACEEEFKNRSISIKIEINRFRQEIEEVRDKLREINLLESDSKDSNVAWEKVSVLIENEKKIVDRFYNRLLTIEKKRQGYAKSILKKYYKIFHKISFLMPYEIQVYLEDEILKYNEAVLGNHRIYADLYLQMNLLADTAKIGFKNWIQELTIDNREAIDINN